MYKYNIYVGMFDKDTKQQELSNTEFLNRIRKTMRLHGINDYTIYKCKGHYKHTDGTIICEPSINIEYIHDYTLNQIHNLRFNLCKELNQESVLITKQEVTIL